jgi:cyclic pyranopterin phosphate synthase
MRDGSGRRLSYLRLSVTDVCNFRCAYCLPGGWRRSAGEEPPLSVEEIRRLVAALAALGVAKVRLTGGEPTLRPDLPEIAAAVAATPGVERVALTTNGHDLERSAAALRRAGVSALNLSVDSLDPARFAAITGRDVLARVRRGVDAALAAGFERVKVNAVLLRTVNDGELERFVEWTREQPIAVRFIELMPCGADPAWYARHHLAAARVEEALLARGWTLRPREAHDGPARELVHPAHAGSVGVVAPHARDFCGACNRLRVTSRGALRLCLFGDRADVPLRPLLRADDQREALVRAVARAAGAKPPAHRLARGDTGRTRDLAAVGG